MIGQAVTLGTAFFTQARMVGLPSAVKNSVQQIFTRQQTMEDPLPENIVTAEQYIRALEIQAGKYGLVLQPGDTSYLTQYDRTARPIAKIGLRLNTGRTIAKQISFPELGGLELTLREHGVHKKAVVVKKGAAVVLLHPDYESTLKQVYEPLAEKTADALDLIPGYPLDMNEVQDAKARLNYYSA